MFFDGPLGIVHQHHWVTPEERGERQPLRRGEYVLAFDGRLDNRRELLRTLALSASDGEPTDAELVLAAHSRWGDSLCERLIGPFAFILFDLAARRGLMARDALGDRTLFYAEIGPELAIASEEAALLAHPGLSTELDETRLAHYFAARVPGDGSSFFAGVSEVRPATVTAIADGPLIATEFWSPPSPESRSARNRDEVSERYRELLARSVRSRLRSAAPAAVLMSGGLDSTSIAALAAESAGEPSTRGPVRAISWVFDSLDQCDERAFIRPVVEKCGLEGHEFVADGLGPLPDGEELCLDPNGPEENPYRRLKARAYAEASGSGSVVLLSGGSADTFYAGFQRWFVDLSRAGAPLAALGELLAEIRRFGLRTGLSRAGFGQLRRAFQPTPERCPWLTPWARRLLEPESAPSAAPALARARAVAGSRQARGVSLEIPHACRHGVDLRHPYRDRRLVEFVLSLPAYELYRGGRLKDVARRAMVGRLPESVRNRTGPTRLTPLFERALRGPAGDRWARWLRRPAALWPRYVRSEWVDAALSRSPGPTGDVVLWNCLALEVWRSRFDL